MPRPTKPAYRWQGYDWWLREIGGCAYCGARLTDLDPNDPASITAEHVLAKALGGKDDAGNVIGTCKRCNNGRGHLRIKRLRDKRGSFWIENEGIAALNDGSRPYVRWI